jgi:hypothetical protein
MANGTPNVGEQLAAILRSGAIAGLEAMAAFFAEEVKAEAPGQRLKASIGWFREELSVIIGPVHEPLPPWWRIAEFGGWIRAKNWFPYVHSARAQVGPLLWIPFAKGGGGGFGPTVKLMGRSGGGVALAYDPGSKTLGGPVAALKGQVYHPPHAGHGYLNWVIQQKMDEGVAVFSGAMQGAFDAAE